MKEIKCICKPEGSGLNKKCKHCHPTSRLLAKREEKWSARKAGHDKHRLAEDVRRAAKGYKLGEILAGHGPVQVPDQEEEDYVPLA